MPNLSADQKIKSKSPLFTVKVMSACVSLAMLAGCQNLPSKSAVVQPTHTLLSDASNAHQAKAAVMDAHKNLNKELYINKQSKFKILPLIEAGHIDENSATLATTLANLYLFDATNTDNSITVTNEEKEAYLQEPELPYLRYSDELQQRTDVDTVTRAVGMSDEYQELSSTIDDEIGSLDVCFFDLKYQFENYLAKHPQANSKDKTVATYINEIGDCAKEAKQASESLSTHAQGYQKQDLARMNTCNAQYHKNLQDLFSTKAKYAMSREQAHQVAAAEFYECGKFVDSENSYLEPARYLGGDNLSQRHLYGQFSICLGQYNQQKSALQQAGKSYLNHPEAYQEAFLAYADCVDTNVTNTGLLDISDVSEEKTVQSSAQRLGEIRNAIYDLEHLSDEMFDEHDSRKLLPQYWLDKYKTMKTTQTVDHEHASEKVLQLFSGLRLSPSQIKIYDSYYVDNLQIDEQVHYRPAQRQLQFNSQISLNTPTQGISVTVPWRLDFNQAEIVADVSAALPLYAAVNPKSAPLPHEIPNGLARLELPKDLKGVIPMPLLFDAVNVGYLKGIESLYAEKFTLVDAREDVYAKQLNAAKVIKLNLSAKDLGKVYGVIVKHVVSELKAYVDAHPELYTSSENGSVKPEKIKNIIETWAMMNQDYQTQDIGSLFSLVEAVLPTLNYEGARYFYLDKNNQLLGMQLLSATDDQVQNTRILSSVQMQISSTPFDESFAQTHKHLSESAINLNQVIQENAKRTKLLRQACQARDCEDYFSTEEVVEIAAADAEAAAVEAVATEADSESK